MRNDQIVDQLRNDSRIVLRYWRTIENWSPTDLEEARQALLCAVNAGGDDLDSAAIFYAELAASVRHLVIDCSTISVSVPAPTRYPSKNNAPAHPGQLRLA